MVVRSAAFQRLLAPPVDIRNSAACAAWNGAINRALDDTLPALGWPELQGQSANHSSPRLGAVDHIGAGAGDAVVGTGRVGEDDGVSIDCTRWYIEPPEWPSGKVRMTDYALPVADGPLYAWLAAWEVKVATCDTMTRLFRALTNHMGCGTPEILNRTDWINATPLMQALLSARDNEVVGTLTCLMEHPLVHVSLSLAHAMHLKDDVDRAVADGTQTVLDVAISFNCGLQCLMLHTTDEDLRAMVLSKSGLRVKTIDTLHYAMSINDGDCFIALWPRCLRLLDTEELTQIVTNNCFDGWSFTALAASRPNVWSSFLAALDHPQHRNVMHGLLTHATWTELVRSVSEHESPIGHTAAPIRGTVPATEPPSAQAAAYSSCNNGTISSGIVTADDRCRAWARYLEDKDRRMKAIAKERVDLIDPQIVVDAAGVAVIEEGYLRKLWWRRDPLRSAIRHGHESIAVYIVEQCLPNWALDTYDVDGQTVLMRAVAANKPMPRLVDALLARIPHLDPGLPAIELAPFRTTGLTVNDLLSPGLKFGRSALDLVPSGATHNLVRSLVMVSAREHAQVYVPAARRILIDLLHLERPMGMLMTVSTNRSPDNVDTRRTKATKRMRRNADGSSSSAAPDHSWDQDDDAHLDPKRRKQEAVATDSIILACDDPALPASILSACDDQALPAITSIALTNAVGFPLRSGQGQIKQSSPLLPRDVGLLIFIYSGIGGSH